MLREATGSSGTACTAEAHGGRLALQQEQAANAATISAVATSRHLPRRALTIALATAMQESGLRDVSGGDRDSLGLFQQRPSQGWGTARQILDPVYAANRFFDELVRIPGYARLPLTTAAQRVQHSGFPRAYAKREADASLVAAALSGARPGLTCQVVADDRPGDPAVVVRLLAREFGTRVPAPYGPVDAAGTVAVPQGPTGPAAGPVAGPGAEPARDRRGWLLAQWAVAHAPRLRIAEVDYRGRVWRATDSASGWTVGRGVPGQPSAEVRITVER